MSNSLQPHRLQHVKLPCRSSTPGACSNSCPLSWWCHPTISSSIIPFPSCLQSFPASGFFPMSQLFASDGQSIGASTSASVLPMNIQDWSPLGWTGLISLQSKGLSRVSILQKKLILKNLPWMGPVIPITIFKNSTIQYINYSWKLHDIYKLKSMSF